MSEVLNVEVSAMAELPVDTFVDAAWKMAAAALEDDGRVLMSALMINRQDGSIMIVPSAGVPSKAVFASLIYILSEVHNGRIPSGVNALLIPLVERIMSRSSEHLLRPDLVIHVSEAWMLKTDAKDRSKEEIEKLKSEIDKLGSLEEHPDSIEVVIIGWKTKDGESSHVTRQINRDADGKPSLGERVDIPGGAMISSRFLDRVFESEKVLH